VAGTHGKTTTTAMLAWILEDAGLAPGFLVGGVPADFGVSARLGRAPFFVVEADEYDTAFFDKRSKFVHYAPRTAILNNLEFDHADIFPDLAAIERQFHHLVRTIPGDGLIVHNADDANLDAVLALGCWTPRESFGLARGDWRAVEVAADGASFAVAHHGATVGAVRWSQAGMHNVANALAAIAAARHAGVPVEVACHALSRFRGVKRRLELLGEAGGVAVYDDFAHHPTAVRSTIEGLRRRGAGRILALLEPRSATMRMGVHRDALGPALADADLAFIHAPTDLGWNLTPVLAALGARGAALANHDALIDAVVAAARPGDRVLVMSNGGFGGIHGRLLEALRARG
jgi:UDP-N-acetylmuramate: L-alanyl-gamma-D-glutamyl-meso-diaminopimelate ligase